MQFARSLLIINYRSASLTRDAIRTARAASSEPLHVVVVDNTCDPAEADALREAGADAIVGAERNLGYAGGINRGAAECQGSVLIVANPDVQFRARSIDHLVGALRGRVGVSGPAFTWDHADRWWFPPAEMTTAATKLADLAAMRLSSLASLRDRARTRERIRFWSATETRNVEALSGAVLCFRRALLDEIGPFDERFPLYFEETDFMRRVRTSGRSLAYVPAAVCRHLYSQSAGAAEQATYVHSEIEYLRKWEGETFVRMLRWLGAPRKRTARLVTQRPDDPLMLPGAPEDFVIEVSPDEGFSTAAGHFPESSAVVLPAECWESYRAEELFARVVERRGGTVVSGCRISKSV